MRFCVDVEKGVEICVNTEKRKNTIKYFNNRAHREGNRSHLDWSTLKVSPPVLPSRHSVSCLGCYSIEYRLHCPLLCFCSFPKINFESNICGVWGSFVVWSYDSAFFRSPRTVSKPRDSPHPLTSAKLFEVRFPSGDNLKVRWRASKNICWGLSTES
jgi:hypothetical protein